jgi:hypothetical protein
MSIHATIVVDLIIAILIFDVLRLVIGKKLYVGYAVIWLGVLIAFGVLVSVPPILNMFTRLMGTELTLSALILMALMLVFWALIYLSSRLSILADRVTKIAQYIGTSELEKREDSIQGTGADNTADSD